MHKRVISLVLVVVMFSMALLAGCGGSVAPTKAPEPTAAPAQGTKPPEATAAPTQEAKPPLPAEIVLPVIGPMTGPLPSAGEDFKQGAQMAVDEINAKGGIRGSKLKLEFFDTKMDPTEAANLARKIVADKRYPLLIGPWSSSECLAALPILEEAKMVMWTPAASSAQIAESPWGFKISTDNQIYGALMSELAVSELGFKKIAILFSQNDFAINLKSPMAGTVKQLGGEVVLEEGFTPNTQDYRALLSKVKQSGAEAILLACYSQEGALIINQARELGITAQFIGDGVFFDQGFFDVTGKNAEGLYAIGGANQLARWDPSLVRPEVEAFYKRFEELYGEPPQSHEIPTYDVVYMVAHVIDQVGTDRVALREAIEGIENYPGIVGSLTIGKLHWPLVDLWYLKYENGRYVEWKDAPEAKYAPR